MLSESNLIPDQRKPLEGARLGWMTLALALATFMQVLDTTIANVAIPIIAGNLGISNTQGTWVITSFGVANAIALPITGWLAKQIGEVRLFLWSMFLFVFASLLCGLANSLSVLVSCRVLQGIAAGPLVPLSQSLLLNNYPPLKRPMALALWAMTVITAPICGPILGGWISDNYHWGWIFFINIPIGLLATLIAWQTLKARETAVTTQPIDSVGLGLLVLGIGCLQLMLDQGKEFDWFNSIEIIVLTVIAIISIVALIIWEFTDEHPIIDLSLFCSSNFTLGVLCTALAYLLYIGAIVLLPLLLQSVMGYTATWAGLAAAPIGFLPLIVSPLIGRFNNKLDMRLLVTISFLVFALCFYWRSATFSPTMTFAAIAWPQFVQGLAVACFFMPLTAITMSGLQNEQLASAASLSNCIRTLSGSIGTSITTTLWSQREALHHLHFAEKLDAYNPLLTDYYRQLAQLGVDHGQATGYLAEQITGQSLIIAANEIFWLSSLVFLALLLPIWCAKPPFGSGEVGH